MLPVSVFIIAKNEEDRIAEAIGSVSGWLDEIVVIDSGSSDRTVEVSERLGARVVFHAWEGYGKQKRFGEEQCRNDWLLNLDADEVITPALRSEIQALFASGAPNCVAYHIPVRDLLPGEKKLAPGAHTNRCIRLYDRRLARFSPSPVHDSVVVAGGRAIGDLAQPALHRSFRSFTHAIEKMNSYSTAQAAELGKKGVSLAGLRLLVEFPVAFLKAYCLRLYVLRGQRGFIYSVFYGFSRFARLAKYLENR